MKTNETRMLDIVDELKQENEYLHTEMSNLRDALSRSTEELSVIRQEMKQAIERLDTAISGEFLSEASENFGGDFEEAFICTEESRMDEMNLLKCSLWDMMRTILKNRVSLRLDCPVV